jgi:divalent metal cation (Fe/Co/Zn/Cd) transporter
MFKSFSLRSLVVEVNHVRGNSTWVQFVRRTDNLNYVIGLLEGSISLFTLPLAGAGFTWTLITGDSTVEGILTCVIAILLAILAVSISVESISLAIGEGAPPEDLDRIVAAAVGPNIDRVIHVRTVILAPTELLILMKVGVPRGLETAQICGAIDDAERRIRQAVPGAKLIFIEPDVLRSRATSPHHVEDEEAPEFHDSD